MVPGGSGRVTPPLFDLSQLVGGFLVVGFTFGGLMGKEDPSLQSVICS